MGIFVLSQNENPMPWYFILTAILLGDLKRGRSDSACFPSPVFPEPNDLSVLCFLSAVFPQPDDLSVLCFLSAVFPEPNDLLALCFLSPMISQRCVS